MFSQVRPFAYQGSECCYLPLFFQETPEKLQPSEIDSCATAVGVSILSAKASVDADVKEILQKCCRLLRMIQEPSGGWPSIIPLTKAIKIEKMEGTINDTFFALKALFDAGLPTFRKDITDIPFDEQLGVIRDGLRWLLRNRVRQGWFYVEKEFIRPEDLDDISPGVLPTSNVLLLISKAREILGKTNIELKKHVEINCSPQIEENEALMRELDTAYSRAIEWLRAIQNSEDGGYGVFQGSKTNVSNTILALKALLTDDSEESMKKAAKALRMLLSLKSKKLQKLSDEDIFENYDQIWVCKDGRKTTHWRRRIVHEKYAKALLLQVLVKVSKKKWSTNGKNETLVERLNFRERWKYKKLSKDCARDLLKAQEKSGRLSGAFRGYRHAPLSYPIYAIEDSIAGFYGLLENYEVTIALFNVKHLILGILILLAPFIFVWSVKDYIGLSLLQQILLTLFGQVVAAILIYGFRILMKGLK